MSDLPADAKLLDERVFGFVRRPGQFVHQPECIQALANGMAMSAFGEIMDSLLEGSERFRNVALELGVVAGEEVEGTACVPGAGPHAWVWVFQQLGAQLIQPLQVRIGVGRCGPRLACPDEHA